MIVIETSALLEWLLRTPRAKAIDHFLQRHGPYFCAPHLLDIELVEVLHCYVSKGQVTPQRARDALADLQSLRIQHYGHERYLPRIWELRQEVSARDATFLALAEGLDLPLLTCDPLFEILTGHRARVTLL